MRDAPADSRKKMEKAMNFCLSAQKCENIQVEGKRKIFTPKMEKDGKILHSTYLYAILKPRRRYYAYTYRFDKF